MGKNKAIAFENYLGYNIDNRHLLVQELKNGLKSNVAKKRPETQYGKPYEVRMLLNGVNGKSAYVKTGWIFDNDSNIPRLTSVYVDEKREK